MLEGLDLNERQKKAVAYVKTTGRITNRDYKQLVGATDRTVLRDFAALVAKGVLEKVGIAGRATNYILKEKTRQIGHKYDQRT